ncbi:homoserine dehydrogenase [Rathayibacter toxicus]|uniref:Homoserine dehydrogenase n=1 Tax=Rathayibacter toxicus TaxID=145458 RepID=A0A2S5Y668_9MICO|nr:homoserine dehydrogenase [Rathayibacter toxicus]PPH22631.1 homoserine dehydrogenase [Rathayibacter toxicus]PPH56833.1 homoserine dehydrogenase [Rathayibacter toxicus]PPH59525.1 homoserine dehydrogenase [Rathayibacter toxicus]PPH86755.1 homoserine dehydrogenase [Rathayibacter toxicus]PPI14473.1 homoserine dehydrogenase [Rathayibacter toxicus]
MIEYRSLRVALLGAGSVGAQVARLLLDHGDELAQRVGARLELTGVAVRDLTAPRTTDIPRHYLTTNAEELILGADIVVELLGGLEPARRYILLAISSGADVITANKALLAAHGNELFEAADQVGAQLNYEAAVAGAIPIIRPLRDSLAGDRIHRILGIVNGTTNYILDQMDIEHTSFEGALDRARELGYAEADPTADIEGFDAAQKAAILARLAFHTDVPITLVHREGIAGITTAQTDHARDSGCVVKLLAICERLVDATTNKEGISARVYPALVPRSHPLAAVHGANNAVFVEAEAAGSLMFYGAGAGGVETASAVLGDVVSAARRYVVGGPGLVASAHSDLPVLPIGQVTTRYQITLEVRDRPGVLAQIAGVFADHGASIETLVQTPPVADPLSVGSGASRSEPTATLIIGTHAAAESDLAATVTALQSHGSVDAVTSVLRVEGA